MADGPYAQAHKARGENIVQFLSRVWLKLIQAGIVDLRIPRAKDPSAASIHDPGDRPARLDWALRSRAHRAEIRK
jgi:hypothetical protein